MQSKESMPTIILVISGPGAGKSTQCARLAKQLNFIHLSIGEILRQQRSAPTQQGQKLDFYMRQFQKTGRLMPCDIPLKYLVKRMRKHGFSGNTFLIDGFIKSVYMYHYWDQMIGDNVNVIGVLYLLCSEETLLARLLNRAKTSDREDDKNTELAKVRLKTFQVNTVPVLALYEDRHLLWIVDAEKTMEQVYQGCRKAVEGMIAQNAEKSGGVQIHS